MQSGNGKLKLKGNLGDDVLIGQSGDGFKNNLFGGMGNNTITGGDLSDKIFLHELGHQTITNFAATGETDSRGKSLDDILMVEGARSRFIYYVNNGDSVDLYLSADDYSAGFSVGRLIGEYQNMDLIYNVGILPLFDISSSS